MLRYVRRTTLRLWVPYKIMGLNWELRAYYQLHRRRHWPVRPCCQWLQLRWATSEPIGGKRRHCSLYLGPCTLSGRAWGWIHGAVMGFWKQWRVHGGEGNKQWMPSLSYLPPFARSGFDWACAVPVLGWLCWSVEWRKMGFGWFWMRWNEIFGGVDKVWGVLIGFTWHQCISIFPMLTYHHWPTCLYVWLLILTLMICWFSVLTFCLYENYWKPVTFIHYFLYRWQLVFFHWDSWSWAALILDGTFHNKNCRISRNW